MPIHGGLLLLGLALLLVGLGFKVAAVPFHSWSPDVYDGAPTPSVAFMAGAVKAAAFAALIRVFVLTFPNYVDRLAADRLRPGRAVDVVGSVLAIVQTNVKRMLAYSSISHAGFILVGGRGRRADGTSAVLFYLAAYTFMVAGSLRRGQPGRRRTRRRAHHRSSDYRGLSRVEPAAGLRLHGVPAGPGRRARSPAGFFAKFYVIGAVGRRQALLAGHRRHAHRGHRRRSSTCGSSSPCT